MQTYPVDIPNSYDPTGNWINLDSFDTKADAIAYVRETFGADEDGCICLVSEFDDGDDEDGDDEDGDDEDIPF
jgi:hypothetical protein